MEELERKVEEPGFWDRPEESQKLMKELKYLQELVKQIRELYRSYEDIGTLIEMGYEENDPEIAAEAERDLQKFAEVFEELKIQTLLSGEYDSCNAIVTIHAGAGGTESCDWASMLYRMYSRWAERKGFQIQVLDFLDGDIAGIKTVTFEVNGENAYGYMKSEKGVHRLVRISPFNSAGKRQTSFASCDVVPDIEDEIDIEISDDDLKIDTYRASGSRRAACQQDLFRHPDHPSAYRDRSAVPE